MTSIDLHSPITRKLVSIITFSFLITFACSRLFVYLVLGHLMPDFFLTIKGVHIHHFTYGLFILVFVGLYFILKRPEYGSNSFRNITIIYGIGLGLTFDEFGMWIRLQDNYWVRQSYDAVIIVTLLLFNIAYYKTLFSWLKEAAGITKRFLKK